MEVVWPYNLLLGIVLSIEFCNVFKGGSHMINFFAGPLLIGQ